MVSFNGIIWYVFNWLVLTSPLFFMAPKDLQLCYNLCLWIHTLLIHFRTLLIHIYWFHIDLTTLS